MPPAGGDRGGGAERAAQLKQYDYKANSNLVLTAETRTRDAAEPSGEPETLWGRMKGKMGDRVQFSRPGEDRKPKKAKRDAKRTDDLQPRKQRKTGGGSVLDIDTAAFYRPKTKETRDAYEAMLAIVRGLFGDQPQDILKGAADEVLVVLKDDHLKDPEREKQLTELLGAITSEQFHQFVQLGKMITDFGSDTAAVGDDGGLDENIGVAVEFEDEDDDDDDGVDVIEDVEDDDENAAEALTDAEVRARMDVDAGEEAAREGVNVQEIDAYWLQRKVARGFGDIDPEQAQQLAEEVFSILEKHDRREAENMLVQLLNFEKFELIKELLTNQLAIVWCTKLARAQDDSDRNAIETVMRQDADTAALLDALHSTRASAKDRQNALERNIREEAKRLRQAEAVAVPVAVGGPVATDVAGRRVIDLDDLAFAGGGHFNSNRSCQLPQGSFRTTHKGYEEVHVPALKPKPFKEGEVLKEITTLPDWAQPAFEGMKALNRIQSRLCDTALFTSENMLICAPTGAGKTNCAMLCILHQLGMHRLPDGKIDLDKFKIVYIAPMKALVAEMVGNFGKRLEPYGVKVRELTGDLNLTKQEIDATQIIVTTPEKWDIITRKSGDRTYTQLVELVIIDEIHLLHDARGPVLESIVARTVRQIESTQKMIRLVGLSATLPNFEDVAAFLRVKPDVGLFYFDNSFRPCPLAQQYIGVNIKKPLQRFQLMNEICYQKCLDAAGKHQVLIFVHSRKETAKTAKFLKEEAMKNDTLAKFMKTDSGSREVLQTEAETVKNMDLKDLLPYGFAIHHAGMSRLDRTLVEDLFAGGHIQVLVSTATLAWGVNLPAHTVIIKGTQVYNPVKGGWDELSPLDVMQMFGRAGRPQYDSYGEGIIITGHSELQFYLSLFNMQLPIESQYVGTLPDNLNAEVVLGTVQNLKEAASWLEYTYLYVRMLCNPSLYGVSPASVDVDPMLVERRMDLVHTAAMLLDKHNLIKYDRRTGQFQVTDLGRIASHYYVTYNTIATFNEHLKPTMGDIELLRLFSLADEFKYLIVREEEKLELAKLLERVPIPVKESLDEPTAKINVLLQAYISNLKLEGLALTSDMVYVTQSAGRLMRCLFEVCLKRGWAGLADKALQLCKMVNRRMWGSQTPLRQFRAIPQEVLIKIEKKDLPWDRWYDLGAQELGELIRLPKMGKTLHKLVHQFPKLELAASVQPITRSIIKIDLTITPDFMWDDKLHGFVEPFWIIVEDSDSEFILHHEYFVLKKQFAEDDTNVTFTVPVHEPLPPQYFIRVVSDKWLQCETILPVSFRHLLLPEKYLPPTELLDLQPLPVTALRNPQFEALYKNVMTFNPIQTQVYNALYNLDDSCLVAAPTGSGKTYCAEFAVLRMLQKASDGKGLARCVYIAPLESLAQERYKDWQSRFGALLGINVVMLTGETQTDLKLLEKGNIVISTPEHWDVLSRRWKQRKNVQAVALFIVDELHLIGGSKGPTMEVVTSRMRQISSQLPTPIRMVGLSTSLANAKDLGEWIGATSNGLFNFPPGVRPVPLEIHIQGFEIANFESRMQAMTRPAFNAVNNYATDGKPALLFVPTRKHARLVALDLLTFAAAEGAPQKFLQVDVSDLDVYLAKVKDAALKHSLQYGVAFLHETMTKDEQDVVNLLFGSGAIQVVVATAPMCWGLSGAAHLVVIMGTQYFDGTGQGGNDYPVTDLLQMIGRASRPGVDDVGRCVLMCHTPRKEYYKKFLFEPFPVESHLDQVLHDHFVAEIVTRTITNKQDAVDWLTWTFYYRRLSQNPNYYNMMGVTHRHVSDHLSDLVETIISDLENSKVIAVEDDMDLEPLNLAVIAAYYYISYTTIELFSSSLTSKTKLKGLLEILSAASEFDSIPIRIGEEEAVRKLLSHAPVPVTKPKYTDPHTKVNALLQCHFSRQPLGSDLAADQKVVVKEAVRLLQAMVDVISSSGWLNPALSTMELSQMVVQAMWERDSALLQLPHFTKELSATAAEGGVETIFDLLEMEDADRLKLLETFTEHQLEDVARAANRYPDINLKFDVVNAADIHAGETVTLTVNMEREYEGELPPVQAPFFAARKDENWWLVVGHKKDNNLLAIKRVALQQKAKAKLEFSAPKQAGKATMTLSFMCDSYMGCDQEYDLELDVKEAVDGEENEMSE